MILRVYIGFTHQIINGGSHCAIILFILIEKLRQKHTHTAPQASRNRHFPTTKIQHTIVYHVEKTSWWVAPHWWLKANIRSKTTAHRPQKKKLCNGQLAAEADKSSGGQRWHKEGKQLHPRRSDTQHAKAQRAQTWAELLGRIHTKNVQNMKKRPEGPMHQPTHCDVSRPPGLERIWPPHKAPV